MIHESDESCHLPFGLRPGFAEADADADAAAPAEAEEDGAADADAVAEAVAVVIAGAAETTGFVVVGCAFEPKPKSCGARHSTIPRPMRLTRTSMMEKTKSFCFVDGPRARTTTVGVRGRRGRSGMRIVSATCPGRTGGNPSATGSNACGVLPVGACAGAARMPPELGVPTACGPDDG